MKNTLLAIAISSTLLSACGGGGSSDAPSSTVAPATDSGGCLYNPALYQAGNTYSVESEYLDGSGAVTSRDTRSYVVNGPTVFDGYSVVEIQSSINKSTGATQTIKDYYSLGNAEVLKYGFSSTSTFSGSSFTDTTHFVPPEREPHTLQKNVPFAQSFSASGVTVDQTITYLGTESITVPAGTFSACKLQNVSTTNGSTSRVTVWVIADGRYQGLNAKMVDETNVITKQSSKLTFNGL